MSKTSSWKYLIYKTNVIFLFKSVFNYLFCHPASGHFHNNWCPFRNKLFINNIINCIFTITISIAITIQLRLIDRGLINSWRPGLFLMMKENETILKFTINYLFGWLRFIARRQIDVVFMKTAKVNTKQYKLHTQFFLSF